MKEARDEDVVPDGTTFGVPEGEVAMLVVPAAGDGITVLFEDMLIVVGSQRIAYKRPDALRWEAYERVEDGRDVDRMLDSMADAVLWCSR
jgi:hypothetical protein